MSKPLTKKQWLESLQKTIDEFDWDAAYAEQGEPVAWLCRKDNGHFDVLTDQTCKKCFPVYTTPQPAQKPLTHEQRFDLLTAFEPHKNKWEAPAILIDMVEAAHGIKE